MTTGEEMSHELGGLAHDLDRLAAELDRLMTVCGTLVEICRRTQALLHPPQTDPAMTESDEEEAR